MASYNRPTAGPSRPLINRPQTSAPQPNPYGHPSALGQSIAGALSGIRPPGQQAGVYPPPPPAGAGYWPAPGGGVGGLPSRPGQNVGYSAGYQQGPGGYGYPPAPNPYGHVAYGYPALGVQPPTFPPPQSPYQSHHYQPYDNPPPPQPYPQPQTQTHHSLPLNPMRNSAGPTASTSHLSRTTPDGYTISSAYTPPTHPPQNSNGNKQSAPRPPKQSKEQGASSGGQPRQDQKAKTKPSGGGGGGGGGGPQVVSCQVAGCTFTGGKKAVREHEEDRHLIYLPGREPAPWSGSYKPVDGALIEGTAIALDSPEAVAKWIEERKKRWPSNKVVEDKEKLHPGSTRGGRGGRGGRGRGRGGRMMRPGGGAGGIWGDEPLQDHDTQSSTPVLATPARMLSNEPVNEEPVRKKPKLDVDEVADGKVPPSDDEEAGASGAESDDDGPPVEASSRVPVPGLATGTEDSAELASSGRPSIHPSRLAAQGEGDTEVEPEADAGRTKSSSTVVCRYFKTGKCHQGDQCPFLHITSDTPALPPKRKRPAPPPPAFNPFARADPFAQLAERDWSHLVSDALQAIEFLEGNGWLKGVELRAGQVEEESGIEVLAESGGAAGAEGGGEDVLMGGKEAGIEEMGEEEQGGDEAEGDKMEGGEGEQEGEEEEEDEDESLAVAELLVQGSGGGAEAAAVEA